jgi:hypothetical protein
MPFGRHQPDGALPAPACDRSPTAARRPLAPRVARAAGVPVIAVTGRADRSDPRVVDAFDLVGDLVSGLPGADTLRTSPLSCGCRSHQLVDDRRDRLADHRPAGTTHTFRPPAGSGGGNTMTSRTSPTTYLADRATTQHDTTDRVSDADRSRGEPEALLLPLFQRHGRLMG